MTITSADFPDYYRAVHGYDPFPWQSNLVKQVLDTGDRGGWPDVLAVPTGCGKTSALDVAIFALAAQPERFPRRVVMVIDRRLVVDQGYAHASRISAALASSPDPVVCRVSEKLRFLWGGASGESPIECAVLRGGMARDDDWAQRPDRPVLVLSTVDQVGSRLLFRGYGVSQKMASVHAGLLGHDTLFLLDEVHLAAPFAQTLLALRSRWRGFWPNPLPERWGVVRLSATPGLRFPEDRVFTLAAGGEDDEHPRLKPRLQARKPATLRSVAVKGKDESAKRHAFASACASAALKLLSGDFSAEDSPKTIGLIVNRVATAREIAALLENSANGFFEVQLLTGRMRPVDRDAVLEKLQPRIQAGRDRNSVVRPLIVVATQCIEAGADFDFDALITECSSLDALRQRFGRLDRLGERHGAGRESPALILGRSDQLGANADPDPVYGASLKATWDWLNGHSQGLDFGIRHLPSPTEEVLPALIAPLVHAPVLLPSHLDAWNQTHPWPEPDPDVALWLHGPRRGEPEVQLVWRADFNEEMLKVARAETPVGRSMCEALIARLVACPPCGAEALALPISAVRRWLHAQPARELSDTAIQQPPEDEDLQPPGKSGRLAFQWSGDDSMVVGSADLTAGMTVVVPAGYGGISHGNWDPEATEAVSDQGDLVQWQRHQRATLRLNAASLPTAIRTLPLPRLKEDEGGEDVRQLVRDWLDALPADIPSPWREIVAALGRNPRVVVSVDGGLTLIARKASRETASTEDDGASFIEREVTLAAHSKDVWRWAEAFARRIGLPDAVREDLALAAWLHDVGKADPRFQRWLVGGSAVRLALLDAPLAKSAQTCRDRRAGQQARLLAGYPDGYRHELLSVAMIANNARLLEQAHDRELVLHLVGSHHGWCRPFAPFNDHAEDIEASVSMTNGPRDASADLTAGTRHQLARLDSGVTDRFWTLTQRYGWWGLAWLEAILRLADHRASAMARGEGNE